MPAFAVRNDLEGPLNAALSAKAAAINESDFRFLRSGIPSSTLCFGILKQQSLVKAPYESWAKIKTERPPFPATSPAFPGDQERKCVMSSYSYVVRLSFPPTRRETVGP